MAKYNKAHWKPVRNHTIGGVTAHKGLILHVTEGNGSEYGWFNNPSAEVSANFWVGKAGTVEQYVDTSDRAWAQAAGNSEYASVETEGFATEDLTLKQVFALAELYRWGHKTHGWLYKTISAPGKSGFGWHGMGGTAWGGHFGCPGDLRKHCRKLIVSIARGRLTYVGKRHKNLRAELLAFKKSHKIKNRTYFIGHGVRKAAGL